MRAGKLYGRFATGGRTFVGEIRDDEVLELNSSLVMDVATGTAEQTDRVFDIEGLRLLVPVDRPSRIICIGLNYRSHIREMKWETPGEPVIFTKPPSAIVGPGEDIVIPNVSSRVDFEGESAIVIGRKARNVREGSKHIFGYTCFNDVTARDLQKKDVDWTRAKGFDTFAPIGPFISTKSPARISTRLNGRVVQESPLSDRVFDDGALVGYVSTIMTLEPGDIIATGTPSGIGPLRHGDIVQIELDTVGTLTNQVVQSP